MDIHIVIHILLDYFHDMPQWSIARLLNRATKYIVDTIPIDNTFWGRRSFIMCFVCNICNKHMNTCSMLNYMSMDNTCMFHITHCPTWQCKMTAIHSMLAHCASYHIYMLSKPFQDTNDVIVPRSDGSHTPGKCHNNRLYLFDNKLCVFTFWRNRGYEYTKLVPLEHYTDNTPHIMFKCLDPILTLEKK